MTWTAATPRLVATALLIGALTGCGYIYGGSVASEKDRLVASGYRMASGTDEKAGRYVLEYSGAPVKAVKCRPASGGAYAGLPATALVPGGTVAYRNDIRVTLVRPGPLSFERPREDAFFVVTAINTRAGSDRPDAIETISFSSGQEAAFRSGLSCRAG